MHSHSFHFYITPIGIKLTIVMILWFTQMYMYIIWQFSHTNLCQIKNINTCMKILAYPPDNSLLAYQEDTDTCIHWATLEHMYFRLNTHAQYRTLRWSLSIVHLFGLIHNYSCNKM